MVKDNSPTTIAIIGGGFSGSLVATHLLRGATCPLEIKLIERNSLLGRGVAYGTSYPCHLLNVPAGKMSAFPDDPDHFLRWVQTEERKKGTVVVSSGVRANSFVPRKIYGAYVQAVLDEAEASAPDYVRLERITDEAISVTPCDANAIEPKTRGAIVYLRSGQALQADRIVLALGNFPPSDPPVQDGSFYNSKRYRGYAWSADALTGLAPNDPVLLIGSGLTMLDLAVALRVQGHQGLIYLVSRHGLLPHSHKFTVPYPSFLSTDQAPKTTLALVREVRNEVELANTQGQDWRAVIDSLRPRIQQLWQSLPLVEKRRFLRHIRPYWEVHRHRVAPEVADTVSSMLHSGQLIIHAGRIQAYQEDCNGVDVVIRLRQTRKHTVLRVTRVINCTGTECDYRKFQHPLLVNLSEQGLIRPDALALGFDVAPNGALIGTNGVASQLLFTLGSSRKGTLWETTAVPEIRVQAVTLAKEINIC